MKNRADNDVKVVTDNMRAPHSFTNWDKVREYGLLTLKLILLSLGVYVLLRIIAFPLGYSFFVGELSLRFGLEPVYARSIAIGLTAVLFTLLPSVLMATLFGVRARRVTIIMIALSSIYALAIFAFTRDVYFDRKTGASQKCYAKTLEGFKFSSTCDYDPKLGVRFQKITPEVMKEIVFWEKYGKLNNQPRVVKGEYFDALTGEPIVWYSVNDGVAKLYPLPGFDPLTGDQLKPISKEFLRTHKNLVDAEIPTRESFDTGTQLARNIESEIDRYVENITRIKGLNGKDKITLFGPRPPNLAESRQMRSDSLQRIRAWIAWQPIHNGFHIINAKSVFRANRLLVAGRYRILVVDLINPWDHETDFDYRFRLLDRNAHDVPITAIAGERIGPEEFDLLRVTGRFNPREILTIYLIIKDIDPNLIQSGSVGYKEVGFFDSGSYKFEGYRMTIVN